MRETLSGCNVAILTTNGFDRRRFLEARARLAEEGAITTVVSSTCDDLICSWPASSNGFFTAVDRHVCDVHPPYDALFLPGTVVDPEAILIDPRAADFVKSFFDLGRPIASLCRDRWILMYGHNILGGRLKPEPLVASDIVFPQSTSNSGVSSSESCEDLDGFIRKMLTVFQARLAQKTCSSTPYDLSRDFDRRSRSHLHPAGDVSTTEIQREQQY